ncbi:thioredoxin family protein [Listeria seeligeri]|nr:thioredoxin family protein [Listeria seeligeri]MBC1815608.1 thioredoxin family protein [Listeria seeligeri]MBC1849751.1 thioredoxin family protein [Listeria seeligeri]MBC1855164.1 thioredoxin family protein [Listeria seeligeri]MBC1871968.1 thioredoxin family protein [Listeria seeligeri]MBC6160717.1 thioredoxin family protein [Listeria seeligeri]
MKNSYYILSLFSKENCSPCIMTGLALQQVVLPANVVFERRKLEIDGEEVFRACGVQSTPTLVLYRSTEEGQITEVRRHVGGANVAAIESLLNDI